jgi:uncharacterized protein YjdB
MKKIIKIFLMAFVVILLIPVKVLAETNEQNNTVQLVSELLVDNSFNLYISTSDTEKGELMLSGPSDKVYKYNYLLDKGKKYYLHIEAKDAGVAAAFIGRFELNGSGLVFKNNSKILTTNISDFKVSKTGFGINYETPSVSTYNYSNVYDIGNNLSSSKWIWTNNGKDVNCIRYFSAEIVPSVNSPTNLVAIADNDNKQINLSWNTVSGSAITYNVYRSETSGSGYKLIGSTNETSFPDKNTILEFGKTYYYVVTAVDQEAEGGYSNEASAILNHPVTPSPVTLKVVLEVGEELQLSVDDDLGKNTDMTWTSSDNTVATVDVDGVVTALKHGNTIITVVSKDGTYTDKINVLVVDDAKDLRLAVDLKVGKSCRLTVDDLTNTFNVTWASMDPTVATVASNCKVTAVSKGITLITAADKGGNIIGQIYIRVRQ